MSIKYFTKLITILAVLGLAFALVPDVHAGAAACGGSYTVVKGDTLKAIATKCSTTVSALMLANPKITNANRIYPGQLLVMPGALLEGSGGYDIYIVARGDTLKSLAGTFNTTMDVLLSLNKSISNANLIYEGQRLSVPSPRIQPPSPPPTGGSTYTVKSGDTLKKIATRYGVTLDALLKVHPQITNANLIYTGQTINIPAVTPTYYKVVRGDTLKKIAALYGTTWEAIVALNPDITNPNLIYVGQVIRVY